MSCGCNSPHCNSTTVPPTTWTDLEIDGSIITGSEISGSSVTGLPTPSAGSDAATKAYVDALKVDTVAALTALNVGSLLSTYVQVLGYYVAGDGGGGLFRYASGSSATTNGGTVLAPDSGSGRWLRVSFGAPYNVRWFGAKGDGTTDDTSKIQSAIDTAYADMVGEVLAPSGTYKTVARLQLYEGMTFKGVGYRDNVDVNVIPAQGTSFYFTPSAANSDFMLVQAGGGDTVRCPHVVRDIKIAAMNNNARDCFVLQSPINTRHERVAVLTKSGVRWQGFGYRIYSAQDLTLSRVWMNAALGGVTFSSGVTGVSTTVRLDECRFGLNTNDVVANSFCTDVTCDKCIFESSSGDSIVADCSVVLNQPYFEDVGGSLISAGTSAAVPYVRVIGGQYVDGPTSDQTKDMFYMDTVRLAYLDVGTSVQFRKGALLRSTANTGQVIWVQPYNTVSFSGSTRANSTAYAKGDIFTVAVSGVTYYYMVTTAGTTAGSLPGGYGRTTFNLTDGTAVVKAVDTAVPWNLGTYTALNAGSQGGGGFVYTPNLKVTNILGSRGASPQAGMLGSEIISVVPYSSALSISNASAKTLTSVTLTPGVWDITGDIAYVPSAGTTVGLLAAAISQATNSLPAYTDGDGKYRMLTFPAGGAAPDNNINVMAGPIRMTVSSDTTIYLVAYAAFGTSTMVMFGNIRARLAY